MNLPALCILILPAWILFQCSEAATVNELLQQFKGFGSQYVNYRKMPNEHADEKNTAFENLLAIAKSYKWNVDKPTDFTLAVADMTTFDTTGYCFEQLQFLYCVNAEDDRLKGFVPSSLFQDAVESDAPKARLTEIERFIKFTYARINHKEESQVAYHCQVFTGKRIFKKDDPNIRKVYLLIFLGVETD